MKLYVGVDIGGTHTKITAVRSDGTVSTRFQVKTQDSIGCPVEKVNYWIDEISSALDTFISQTNQRVEMVGVAAPGLVDRDECSIAHMPGRLEGLEHLNWREKLNFELPVPVINDAQAALLAESWIGAVQGVKNVVLLTLGTGVGGALMLNGQVFSGARGRAGHIGHISLDLDGTPDICGMPGSLEEFMGQGSLEKRTRGKYRCYDKLLEDYNYGNLYAEEIWLRSVRALATGIGSVINVLDPDMILLGGGISVADQLIGPLSSFLDEVEWRPGGESVPIRTTELGAYSGAIGAARKAMLYHTSSLRLQNNNN